MDSHEDPFESSLQGHGASNAADTAAKLGRFAPDIRWQVRTATRLAVPSGTIYVVDGSPLRDGPVVSPEDAERAASRVTEEFGRSDMWVEIEASGDDECRAYVVDGIGGHSWGPVRPHSNMGWTEYGSPVG